MTQDIKQSVEAALVSAYRARTNHEFPQATIVPSDEHYKMQAKEFMQYLKPLVKELSLREERLIEALQDICEMGLSSEGDYILEQNRYFRSIASKTLKELGIKPRDLGE